MWPNQIQYFDFGKKYVRERVEKEFGRPSASGSEERCDGSTCYSDSIKTLNSIFLRQGKIKSLIRRVSSVATAGSPQIQIQNQELSENRELFFKNDNNTNNINTLWFLSIYFKVNFHKTKCDS